jgi:hypothetical protein
VLDASFQNNVDISGGVICSGGFKSATIGGTTTSSTASEQIVFRGSGPYPRIAIGGIGDATDGVFIGRNNADGHGFMRLQNGGDPATGIFLQGAGDSYIMGGNVGINNTNPQEKLDVAGNINCTGKIEVDYIGRTDHNKGYMVGSYNNVGANSEKTNPIYTIGTNYMPTQTTLANMYGIGYTHGNASFASSVLSGWGMYVAADGDARIGLDGQYGLIKCTGVYMQHMRRPSVYNSYCEWANGHHFDCWRNGGGHVFHINHYVQQTVYLNRSGYCDRRIKEDIKDIDDVSALNILRKIKPKTYKYKLQPNKGTVYGFIAQDVREILPYATNLTRLSAPFDREDFADANILEDGTVELASPCEQIEVGKNAQFYYETSTSTRDFIVLEILSPTRFKVEIDSVDKEWIGQTKLVGKEVDDFHGIDKDAIFTVATAALQEVDRQLQAEKAKTICLETQLEIYKNDISFIKRENIQLRTDISMIRTHIGI